MDRLPKRLEQLQEAAHLYWTLDNAVGHFAHALCLLTMGEFKDAHWELWMADPFGKVVPRPCVQLDFGPGPGGMVS